MAHGALLPLFIVFPLHDLSTPMGLVWDRHEILDPCLSSVSFLEAPLGGSGLSQPPAHKEARNHYLLCFGSVMVSG